MGGGEERDTDFASTGLFLKCPQQPGLVQPEAKSVELNLGLFHG